MESKWGCEPLVRSSCLVKGMQSVSLSLYFVFYGGLLVFVCMDAALASDRVAVCVSSDFRFSLRDDVVACERYSANTMLDVCCKGLNGGLISQLNATMHVYPGYDFWGEYVTIP
ncbi:LOW QUALITY PROTEIN: hypothetical protein OSB04_018482 [Centaurea solstitialis]|uniref:Uncharacterized protein n=1 Tax=Centaurea solstitialis TaxID=347529 RepID=A0AA38WAJ5_9ASTR|nr:LOW QUALITY PROTEIN: hypothetical protein OSB04_018482 [Centaurea solstitialis]